MESIESWKGGGGSGAVGEVGPSQYSITVGGHVKLQIQKIAVKKGTYAAAG